MLRGTTFSDGDKLVKENYLLSRVFKIAKGDKG